MTKVHLATLGFAALLIALIAFPWQSVYKIRAGKSRAVEEGIERLGDPHYETRERASRRVVSLGEASRPDLEKALSSPNIEVRMRARRALAEIDRAKESPTHRRLRQYRRLIEIGLSHPGALAPGTSRYTALVLDARLATRAAIDVTKRIEDDPIEFQRAIRLLGDLGRPEGAVYLARCLGRGDRLPSSLYEISRALVEIGARDSLPEVRLAAASSDPDTRRYAVRVLGRIGERRDAELTEKASGDQDPRVRVEAAKAIGRLEGEHAEPSLARLTRDENASVRTAALDALANLGPKDGRKLVWAALSDRVASVRAAGLRLLRSTGDAADARKVCSHLGDPSALVREEAVKTISALGLARVAIARALSDSSPAVKRQALFETHWLSEAERGSALSEVGPLHDPWLEELRKSLIHSCKTN